MTDANRSFYLLGTIIPMKCILCLTKGNIGGTNVRNHNGVAVSSKGILEELCQLGIAKWNVLLPLHKSIDATAECKKRAVNVCSFN
jgi:hypothetical protein